VGWFIFAIIFWVVGIIGIFAGVFGGGGAWAAGGVVIVVLGLFAFMFSGFKSVPTKSIGVATSFGQVQGKPYGPGLHVTWDPFLHLNVIAKTIQTTTFEGCQGQFCQPGDQPGITTPPNGDSGSSTAPCLEVRIGGQQAGCLDVTIQWQVLDSAADGLFSDYANHGLLMPDIENAVVIRELRSAANIVLGDYNPIFDVSVTGQAGNSQFTKFQPQFLAAMQADIGSRIHIVSLITPFLRYDHNTQGKLNGIQQQYANTAQAAQEIITNEKLAQAYAKLGTPSVNALVSQCLGVVTTAVKDSTPLPVGFQCFPGAGSGLALNGK
jgi:hypothetical protein